MFLWLVYLITFHCFIVLFIDFMLSMTCTKTVIVVSDVIIQFEYLSLHSNEELTCKIYPSRYNLCYLRLTPFAINLYKSLGTRRIGCAESRICLVIRLLDSSFLSVREGGGQWHEGESKQLISNFFPPSHGSSVVSVYV